MNIGGACWAAENSGIAQCTHELSCSFVYKTKWKRKGRLLLAAFKMEEAEEGAELHWQCRARRRRNFFFKRRRKRRLCVPLFARQGFCRTDTQCAKKKASFLLHIERENGSRALHSIRGLLSFFLTVASNAHTKPGEKKAI